MDMEAGKRVARWISQNPGSGLRMIIGSPDFPGDQGFVDYVLVGRHGEIMGYYRKALNEQGEEVDNSEQHSVHNRSTCPSCGGA